jgi:hypothetical protein
MIKFPNGVNTNEISCNSSLFLVALFGHGPDQLRVAHNDVKQAWQAGYRGQGVTVHVHDQFAQGGLWANLNGTLKDRDYKYMTHGDVVSDVVARTSPSASVVKRQWEDGNIALRTAGV